MQRINNYTKSRRRIGSDAKKHCFQCDIKMKRVRLSDDRVF